MIYRIRKNSAEIKGRSFGEKYPSVEYFLGKTIFGFNGTLFLSASTLIIYQIYQIGYTLRGCFCPEESGVGADLGVIITDFFIYPLSDCYWGVIKKCLNIYRPIFVPNWVNQENQ